MRSKKPSLTEIYNRLLDFFGPQNWWPMQRGFRPPEWEVCLGAILTQNTNWNNVERALSNLKKAKILGYKDILAIKEKSLAELIKPSGYYNQKAKRLKSLAKLVSEYGSVENFLTNVERDELLAVKGIGKETADSILLYACSKPYFVVDAYTRRIFSRLDLLKYDMDYEEIRKFFEDNLPRDILLYREFHALIVKLGKDICKKKPLCNDCPLLKICRNKNLKVWKKLIRHEKSRGYIR